MLSAEPAKVTHYRLNDTTLALGLSVQRSPAMLQLRFKLRKPVRARCLTWPEEVSANPGHYAALDEPSSLRWLPFLGDSASSPASREPCASNGNIRAVRRNRSARAPTKECNHVWRRSDDSRDHGIYVHHGLVGHATISAVAYMTAMPAVRPPNVVQVSPGSFARC